MAPVSVELPADLAAELDPDNVPREAVRLIVLELFREQRFSLGRAAELCSMPLESFMRFAASHGVPPMTYDLEDLAADFRTIDQLGL